MNILAFPGQGSQKIGMGKIFYENFDIAKSVFEEVDDTLNFKLSKLIFDGDISELSLTSNTRNNIIVYLNHMKILLLQYHLTFALLLL